MKLTKKFETQIWKIYDTWMQAYLNADVETYDSYFDKDYHFIGSTNNEEFLNKKDTTEFFRVTGEQFAGMMDLRNESKTIEQFGDHVLLTHICDTWFKNDDDWSYYGRFRLSSVMINTKEGWKFFYQHFSLPDAKSEDGQSIGFDKINAENQELREAIQRRTKELELKNRELEIETALERIRAQAVAMKASSDLLNIVVTMRNEFLKLGHQAHYFWHMMWLPKKYEKAMTSGDGTKIGFVMELPRHIHGDIPLLAKWEKSKKSTVVYAMNVDEAINYVDKMIDLGDFKNIDPQAPTHDDIKHIGGLTFIMARTSHGEIGYSLPGVVKKPPKEDIDILVKFAGAFDLAHQRFLDLQKAEKQARETQIELGLEKVRSRSMAMHHTSELLDTAAQLFHQLEDLGIKPWRCGMAILNTDDTKFEFWSETTTPKGRSVSVNGTTSITGKTHKHVKGAVKAIKEKKDFYNYDLSGKDLIDYINYITKDFNLPEASQNITELPERLLYYCATFSRGVIYGAFLTTIKDAEQQTLKRFAQVFDQTYTRFLDLQKAEAQAREAQIEAALEKVRSRSLAVHKSEEFKDVISIVFEKLKELQIPATAVGIGIKIIGSKDLDSYVCGENEEGLVITNYRLPYFNNKISKDICNAFDNEANVFVGQYTKAVKNNFYRYVLDKTSEFKDLPEDILDMIFNSTSYTITMVSSEYVVFNINDFEGKSLTEHEIDIVKRFSRVFNQAYIRFLDLQKSEAQAREAHIEAALERIRSRSMAMQNSDEFQDVIQVVYNQFELLGLNIDHTGFILDYKNQEDMHIVLADDNAVFPEIRLPYFDCAHWNSFKKAKKNGDSLFTNQLDFKEKNQFYDDIFRFIPDLPKETKTHYLKVPGLAISTVLLDSIGLYIENFEGIPYSDEDNTILMRFGKAFQQTYTRFLDLQKAEAQAREAQIQLSLERVRAKSMAMHSSDQLHDIIGLVFQQFDKLAIHPVNVFLSLFDRQKRILTYRASGKSGKRIPTKQDVEIDSVEAWTDLYNKWINDSSDEIEVLFYPKEIVPDILNLLKDTFLAMPKKDRMTTKDFPEGGYSTLGYTPFGYLGYDHTRPPTEEEKDILKRICTEFGRVYQRFLDLQKAEGQAREAKIETALEKVRSRSMAMHQSDELWEVAELLFEQINGLGIELWSCGFSIWYDDDSYFMGYNPGPDGKLGTPMPIPLTEDVFFTTIRNAKRQGEDFIVFESKGKSLEKTYRYMDKLPVVGEVMRGFVEAGFDLPKFQVTHCGFFSDGHLMFITLDHNPEAIHIFKRFTKVFNQTYTRFLDLQKAEARAKEAQIEAVLERVRSRSLAMHNSDELNDLALVVLKSLGDLGMDLNRRAAGIITFKEDEKDYYQWAASQEYSSVISFLTPYLDHPVQNDIWEARQNNSEFYSKSYTLEEKNTFFSHLYEHTELKTMMSAKDKKQSLSFKYYKVNIAFGKHSALVLVSYTDEGFTEEENNILKRLSKVFEQAYIRFLDLQKAEAQAREAQINLAVERVRAKALAMHKSEEIIEVVAKLKDEVMGLNILGVVAATIFLEAENDSIRMWDLSSLERTDQGYLAITDITFKLKKKDPHLYVKRVWENPEDYFIEIQNSKDLDRIIEFMYENNQLEIAKEVEEYTKSTNLTKLYHASKRLSNGKLCIDLLEEPPEEMQTILNKMGAAFDLAYKRFEDIKKAETQAKEAQIEAALERIRSRSMAMHNTSELSEVILVLFNQFKLLGLTIDTCIIDIFDDLNAGFSVWIGTGTAIYPKQVFLPYMDHPIHQLNKDARQRKIDFFTFDEDKDSKDRYFKHFYANAKGIEVPQERRELIANGVGITGAAALGKHSGVHIWNYRGIKYTNEENDILRRVNKVFQQTYTRFLDLQKAEAREREAIIQASLDRVRAEIASMRDTKDLERITPLVWSELQSLGVPFFRCGVMLVNEDTNILDFYLSNPKGQALAALHLDFDSSDIARNGFEYWQKKEIYIEHWDQNQFIAFMKQLMSQGQITDADTYQGGEIAPTSLTLQFVPFTQGMVYVGSELALSKEELDLVEALGKSLSVAYARYEDFTKLDIAKAKAEKALLDLKSVQQQMIQQEKLASLGQLTAGIAHEIKNPLNFVNNFSDLSIELLDEVFTELEQIPESETKEEILAILKDVKGNLSKVTEHGTRADGIVTSMLQHSRASGSKREPKLFNPLVKEFVNLSFHGMRAGKSPINVKIDLQLDPKVENVTLISEDFSRVILNLCNNAFDAMRDKLIKTKNSSHYSAQLIIQTLKEKNSVTLLIKDNGPGIPDSIKDKILQPFFTTKKGTEGTGLGLSITNDIIKAHGGELSIESKENQGTTFRIQLPK